jgi:hypothetical protein
MSFTLTTSGAAIVKAGAGANSVIVANVANLEKFSDQAEGRIVAQTRRDWVTDYSNLSTEIKGILDDVASSLIAMQIINYDMGGYTSRAEAQTMLNVQDNTASSGINILKDFKSNDIRSV